MDRLAMQRARILVVHVDVCHAHVCTRVPNVPTQVRSWSPALRIHIVPICTAVFWAPAVFLCSPVRLFLQVCFH